MPLSNKYELNVSVLVLMKSTVRTDVLRNVDGLLRTLSPKHAFRPNVTVCATPNRPLFVVTVQDIQPSPQEVNALAEANDDGPQPPTDEKRLPFSNRRSRTNINLLLRSSVRPSEILFTPASSRPTHRLQYRKEHAPAAARMRAHGGYYG